MADSQNTTTLTLAFSQDKATIQIDDDPYLQRGFEFSVETIQNIGIVKALLVCSETTGGFVQLLPELSYMPVIIGNDDQPVFLYQLVEGIDEFLDYDATLAAFPTLNYVQISGALAFLRKVAQINTKHIDIDELEEDFDFNRGELAGLREAFERREDIARVLTNGD